MRGKIGEKISDITDDWSFTTDNERDFESYQRSGFMGNRDCNCTFHDSAFQDRSFKSKGITEKKKEKLFLNVKNFSWF